jgi:hypothetical protein
MTKKNQTLETRPEQKSAVASEPQPMAAAPIDPAAILAERKRRLRAEAWAAVREIVLRPELTENDVLVAADGLETCDLDPGWLTVFRSVIALRGTVADATPRVVELKRQQAEAQAVARTAEEEKRVAVAKFDELLERHGKECQRLWHDLQAAQAEATLAGKLADWFRPLFDPSATAEQFALPAQAKRCEFCIPLAEREEYMLRLPSMDTRILHCGADFKICFWASRRD